MPFGVTSRARSSLFPPAYSIHVATADPSSSNSTSTRPIDIASSSLIGGPQVRPASSEKAMKAWPSSPGALNQATAACWPRALSAGPLTGQEYVFHPSSWTAAGSVHEAFGPPVALLIALLIPRRLTAILR